MNTKEAIRFMNKNILDFKERTDNEEVFDKKECDKFIKKAEEVVLLLKRGEKFEAMKTSYKFGNLLFCPIAHQDLADIKDWRNAQMDICRQWKPLTDYNQEEWWKELSTSDKQVIFAIKEREGKYRLNELIGYCGLVYIDYINRKAEFSILIKYERILRRIYEEDFMATAKMICEYGFNVLNLNKITTETFDFRNHQIELLEQFGFKRDGVLRENQYIKGHYCDSINHSILKREYINDTISE